jgi:hypothetical protein
MLTTPWPDSQPGAASSGPRSGLRGPRHLTLGEPSLFRERENLLCDRIDLDRAIARMPWHYQMMVRLIGEGCSDSEAALRMCVPLSELQRWKAEAVAFLRLALTEDPQ